ncbi:hypothetical protein GCM10010174_69760 [Kutzneria viridogrisea]|uniref:Uncharacterized protein n=1 Tax=Kutzneria viridogrisea TaxID=47990 RepID=A0ABR6BB38_9PSEU|nr:hypothetical protein [Kutzneria viridogrisea]
MISTVYTGLIDEDVDHVDGCLCGTAVWRSLFAADRPVHTVCPVGGTEMRWNANLPVLRFTEPTPPAGGAR